MSLVAWWRSLWATPVQGAVNTAPPAAPYVADPSIPHGSVDALGAATLPSTPPARGSKPGQELPHVAIPPVPRGVAPTAALLRSLGWVTPDIWAAALAPACQKHGITTKLRLAAFLANIGNETGGGATLVENLNYSADALTRMFGNRITPTQAQMVGRIPGKQPADQRAIGNIIYGGEWGKKNLGNTMPGDGWRFRGRGAMQTTGRGNHQRTADAMGKPLDDVFLAWLETPTGAAESAAFFWEWAKCHAPADEGDITRVRRIVNGGAIGLPEVKALYARALAALSA